MRSKRRARLGKVSTKIHAAGDALGLPVRLIASPGQRNDIAFAHDPVDGFEAGATIADKGYDADHLHEKIAERGAEIRHPTEAQPQGPASLRHSPHRALLLHKQFRRVATRYDKLLANFMGFVKLAAIAIWLRC
nr:transposase [Mesorhizobium onobrychidis]